MKDPAKNSVSVGSVDNRFWLTVAAIVVIAGLFLVSRQFASAPTSDNSSLSSMATSSSSTDMTAVNPALYEGATSSPIYAYSCDAGKSITATFHLPEDQFTNVNLSDGRNLILGHAISADGARYANANESIVFWTKGVTAFMQENGTTTYSNCVANRFP